MILESTVIQYLFNHTYNLRKVTEEDRTFVLEAKKQLVKLPDKEDLRILFVLKFPGLLYSDIGFASRYYEKIYNPLYSSVFTPPRGLVDQSSVIVLGIAPGSSLLSYSESCWLHGKSSETLHQLLSFDYHWYFSNVCKEFFPFNKYNEKLVELYYYDLLKELQFFKGQRIIFLGQYDIYDKIIYDLKIPGDGYLKIRHPSFFGYKGKAELLEEQQKIISYIKN